MLTPNATDGTRACDSDLGFAIFVSTVNSVASSICSRYDPAVLRHEVAAMKRHVEQLHREHQHMESEMQYTQHGHRALSLYDSFVHQSTLLSHL